MRYFRVEISHKEGRLLTFLKTGNEGLLAKDIEKTHTGQGYRNAKIKLSHEYKNLNQYNLAKELSRDLKNGGFS